MQILSKLSKHFTQINLLLQFHKGKSRKTILSAGRCKCSWFIKRYNPFISNYGEDVTCSHLDVTLVHKGLHGNVRLAEEVRFSVCGKRSLGGFVPITLGGNAGALNTVIIAFLHTEGLASYF